MVDLVGARTELRRVGADSYVGLCPFHDERTPSFSIKPVREGLLLLRLPGQRRRDPLRAGDRGPRLHRRDRVARRPLRRRRSSRAPRIPARRDQARRRERLFELLDRTCGYYERVLWDSSEGAARPRVPRRPRPRARRSCASSASASRRAPGTACCTASRRGGFSEAELLAAGLVQRSTQRPGSVYDRFRRRITFPLCDQRGRVLGFGARAMRRPSSGRSTSTAPTARSTTRAATSSAPTSRAHTPPRRARSCSARATPT